MSDLRVDTLAIEKKYGLLGTGEEVWNVTPIWSKHKQVLTLENAGPAGRIIDGVIRLFQARTADEHRAAVELFEHDLVWDGPPIRLSNKGHLRLATYLFKYFASLRILPVAAVVSEPGPGLALIELDAVAVSRPHRPLWLPLSRLLPEQAVKNIHLKVGVKGGLQGGKVELLTGRLTNLPPFLPFAWQRTAVGIAMGALPHTLETPLGFLFDFADGGDYYAKKRHAAFQARHPDSTNPTWDYVTDVASDLPGWLVQQGSVAAESLQAVTGRSFDSVSGALSGLVNFYLWLFNTLWGALSNLLDTFTGNGADKSSSAAYSYQPGTQGYRTASELSPTSAAATTAGGGSSDFKAALRAAPATARTTAARPVASAGAGL